MVFDVADSPLESEEMMKSIGASGNAEMFRRAAGQTPVALKMTGKVLISA